MWCYGVMTSLTVKAQTRENLIRIQELDDQIDHLQEERARLCDEVLTYLQSRSHAFRQTTKLPPPSRKPKRALGRPRSRRITKREKEQILRKIPQIMEDRGGLSAGQIRDLLWQSGFEAKKGNFSTTFLRPLEKEGKIVRTGHRATARYYLLQQK